MKQPVDINDLTKRLHEGFEALLKEHDVKSSGTRVSWVAGDVKTCKPVYAFVVCLIQGTGYNARQHYYTVYDWSAISEYLPSTVEGSIPEEVRKAVRKEVMKFPRDLEPSQCRETAFIVLPSLEDLVAEMRLQQILTSALISMRRSLA